MHQFVIVVRQVMLTRYCVDMLELDKLCSHKLNQLGRWVQFIEQIASQHQRNIEFVTQVSDLRERPLHSCIPIGFGRSGHRSPVTEVQVGGHDSYYLFRLPQTGQLSYSFKRSLESLSSLVSTFRHVVCLSKDLTSFDNDW